MSSEAWKILLLRITGAINDTLAIVRELNDPGGVLLRLFV